MQETVRRLGQEISDKFVPIPSREFMLQDLLVSLKIFKDSVRWRYAGLNSDELFDDVDTAMREDSDEDSLTEPNLNLCQLITNTNSTNDDTNTSENHDGTKKS